MRTDAAAVEAAGGLRARAGRALLSRSAGAAVRRPDGRSGGTPAAG